jgi:xylulokinase
VNDVVVGLDIGTSSTKAVAVSADGVVQARASAAHGVSLPQPGWVEQDADATWWEESCRVLREIVESLAGNHRVRALAVSGLGPCVLPTDAALRPLRPAILYGIDSRAGAEVEQLNALLGEDNVLARGGSALTSQAAGPKLLWLRVNEPETWAQTARVFTASSFLIARLTGEYVLDHHSASQFDPLYDLDLAGWATDWAEAIAPGLELPVLVWSTDVCGAIHSAAAEATGLPVGLPVLGGTVDAWAEAHGVGVRRPGDLLLAYGSTMFLVAPVAAGGRHPGLWRTAGLAPGSQTLAAGMATSGLLTAWVSDLTGGSIESLSDAAGAVSAGSDGLLMLPYFAGERSPLFDPGARGVVIGLELRHGAPHLMRAVYEATALSVRHVLAAFEDASGDGAARKITVAGGGTQSALWTQIVSDVTQLPQSVPEQTIGAAYGDALLAAVAAGLVDEGCDWTRHARTIEPRPSNRELYDELFGRYVELYSATRPLIDRNVADADRGSPALSA